MKVPAEMLCLLIPFVLVLNHFVSSWDPLQDCRYKIIVRVYTDIYEEDLPEQMIIDDIVIYFFFSCCLGTRPILYFNYTLIVIYCE